MQHYTYKITNTLSNKQYIGVRSYNGLPENDDYMSSSRYLQADIEKYGKKYFLKEILSVFDTRQKAVEHEVQLHEKYNVTDNNSFYNVSKQTTTKFDTKGVSGAWSLSNETKKKMSAWQKGKPKSYDVWNKGKTGLQTMSVEAKVKMSKSRVGRKWYNNGIEEKFDYECPEGYTTGRIFKRIK